MLRAAAAVPSVQPPDDETAALRALARQMAAVADTTELLAILCRSAAEQSRAAGAAVVEVQEDCGIVECAVGALDPLRAHSFPLEDSLSERAILERSPVLATHYDQEAFPLADALHQHGQEQVLLVPLLAHDHVMGVLVVSRPADAPLFDNRDVQRLEVIADHASLALWKARLLEQAQAADRAKSRFLATISHELRTPLTALTGYGELLADQVIGPLSEQQLDILDRMVSVTQQLSTMIEEILAYTSLEEGTEMVRPSEFLAADLAHAVAAAAEPLAQARGLSMTWQAPREPIRVTSDIDKARQILANLVNNAIKFTDHGGVRLEVERLGGDEVSFAVSDTGVGISPGDHERLFRPFVQLDTGLTRRHGGTGLGLHICQRLAALLGGHLAVESEVGRGTRFTLVLPLEKGD